LAGVIALSLLAAFMFAASAAMQQHAVRTTEAGATSPAGSSWATVALPVVRVLRRVARNRLWLAGTAANVFGSLAQAAALHLGSVSVVQIVLVTQLVFALPLGSWWDRRWPRVRDWLSGVAICGGLAAFLAVPHTARAEGHPSLWRIALAVACAACLAVLLVVAATGRSPLVHGTLVAVGAGVCFAISAVLMKVTLAELLEHGVAATAMSWVGYALAAANVFGFLLEQEAFSAGSLPPAVAAMTITNPVTSYLLAVLAFQAGFPGSATSRAALIGAAILIGVGVVGLAHSPTAHRQLAHSSAT
jgi:drug/metabolite transporter (DMT)-like permease